MIRLEVPAELQFRGVVVRTVAAACRLARDPFSVGRGLGQQTSDPGSIAAKEVEDAQLDLSHDFDAQMVSALSEAFNNIVIHAYPRKTTSGDKTAKSKTSETAGKRTITVEADVKDGKLQILLKDYGLSMDPSVIPSPNLASLPENGMGLFIVRAFVDQFKYQAGKPNVWTLVKTLPANKNLAAN